MSISINARQRVVFSTGKATGAMSGQSRKHDWCALHWSSAAVRVRVGRRRGCHKSTCLDETLAGASRSETNGRFGVDRGRLLSIRITGNDAFTSN
mgnify:CR=1 FL=1|jgi:hypothetical protein